MVSIFAFTSDILIDGVSVPMGESGRKIRPVMSKGQVIAPIRFFERALGASVREDGAALILASAGRVLRITEGDKAYLADGVRGEFSVAPRREKGVLCLPAAETVCALGYEARQFGLMAVMDSEEELERLRLNPEEQATLEQATLGKYNAAYFTEADWKAARDSWRRELCGDEKTNDPSIPGMKNLLEMYDRNSERLRAKMNRDKDAVILFGTKPAKESYDMTLQYHDVLKMAQPYGTIGCRGYKSKELLDDILYAMDWMYDHMYGSNVLSDES